MGPVISQKNGGSHLKHKSVVLKNIYPFEEQWNNTAGQKLSHPEDRSHYANQSIRGNNKYAPDSYQACPAKVQILAVVPNYDSMIPDAIIFLNV